MGATEKSDHIKMKKTVQGSFSKAKMTSRTLVAGLAMAIVLVSVLVPAINGLSAESSHNNESSTKNRGM